MNKFEALKQFMEWPPEWQRLCAEYWIETGEVEPTQVLATADKIQAASRLMQIEPTLPRIGDPFPYDGRELTIRPRKKKIPRRRNQEWTPAEWDYLDQCMRDPANQGMPYRASKAFLEKYPGRSIGAVNARSYALKKVMQ